MDDEMGIRMSRIDFLAVLQSIVRVKMLSLTVLGDR